jgi:hypothetical protein
LIYPAFVNSINLEKIGISLRVLKAEDRPSFDESIFKNLLYDYFNSICSYRKLEKGVGRLLKAQF